MDTKQYLRQIERLEKQIQNKLAEIYQLRTMANSATMKNNVDKVQKSSKEDQLGMIVAKIVDMEKEVDDMIDRRCLIVNQIEGLENVEDYDILAKRYILKQDLKVLAIDRKVSFRYIKKIHSRAIKSFEEKYGMLYADK